MILQCYPLYAGGSHWFVCLLVCWLVCLFVCLFVGWLVGWLLLQCYLQYAGRVECPLGRVYLSDQGLRT